MKHILTQYARKTETVNNSAANPTQIRIEIILLTYLICLLFYNVKRVRVESLMFPQVLISCIFSFSQ